MLTSSLIFSTLFAIDGWLSTGWSSFLMHVTHFLLNCSTSFCNFGHQCVSRILFAVDSLPKCTDAACALSIISNLSSCLGIIYHFSNFKINKTSFSNLYLGTIFKTLFICFLLEPFLNFPFCK